MAESADGAKPAARGRRRHHRVVRPATGGDPERALDGLEEVGPDDDGWAPEGGSADPRAGQTARDRWWQEQRPPHWE